VEDGQGRLFCWIKQNIGDSAWSVGDVLGRLDGWIKQQIDDSAW